MKPSDFFIGSREFFGALIPGLIWLIAAVLIFVDQSIPKLLVYASSTNWIGALSFAGLALLIGTLLQSTSFSLSRAVHRFLREAEQPNSRFRRMNHFLNYRLIRRYLGETISPMSHHTALLAEVEKKLQRDTTSPYLNIKSEKVDTKDQLYKGERQVFTACKRSVLARSSELGRLLKEKEVEVNLIGTLPLPLLFFALGFLLHSADVSLLPLRFNQVSWLWNVGVAVVTLIIVAHLLLRFHDLRKQEVRMCLESFLLIEFGLAESGTQDASRDTVATANGG
jgi:hypothetical protein